MPESENPSRKATSCKPQNLDDFKILVSDDVKKSFGAREHFGDIINFNLQIRLLKLTS